MTDFLPSNEFVKMSRVSETHTLNGTSSVKRSVILSIGPFSYTEYVEFEFAVMAMLTSSKGSF